MCRLTSAGDFWVWEQNEQAHNFPPTLMGTICNDWRKFYKKMTINVLVIQKTLFCEIFLLILLIIKTQVLSSRVSNFDMLIKILFDITRKIAQKTAKRFFPGMNSDVVLNVRRSGHNFWAIRTSPSSIPYIDWLLLKFQSKSIFYWNVWVQI